MNNSKVYIILLNFNGWEDTIECIESIATSAYKNYQIVVVDNNSVNDSMEQFAAWVKKKKCPHIFYSRDESESISLIEEREKEHFSEKTDPIIFIQSDFNNGFPAGNNIGIRYGLLKEDGEYFWILNNDTIVNEDSLKEMVSLGDSDEDFGVVGSKLLFYHNPEFVQTIGNEKVSWKGIGTGQYDGVKDSEDLNGIVKTKSIIGASLLIKKTVIDKIGLMDESYFMYHEESDWCTRARAAGYKLLVTCKSTLLHKEGASTNRKRVVKSFLGRKASRTNIYDFLIWGYYGFRNEIYFVKKNFSRKFIPYLLFVLPKKYIVKSLSVFLFNDDNKLPRLYLLIRAAFDGIFGRMGKQIDPLSWKKKFIGS